MNKLGTLGVKERLADLDVIQDLLECEGHAATNDQQVDLVQKVVDQLDFVGDLGTVFFFFFNSSI